MSTDQVEGIKQLSLEQCVVELMKCSLPIIIVGKSENIFLTTIGWNFVLASHPQARFSNRYTLQKFVSNRISQILLLPIYFEWISLSIISRINILTQHMVCNYFQLKQTPWIVFYQNSKSR